MNMTSKQIIDMMAKISDGVTTVAEAKGISPEELEAIYKIGFGLYTSGRYEDAQKIFEFVCLVQHTNPKFWIALGGARQARGNYREAILAYATASIHDVHLAKPHYYAAECFLAMGDLDSCESGCTSVAELCEAGAGDNDKYREKAEALLKKVQSIRAAAAESAK